MMHHAYHVTLHISSLADLQRFAETLAPVLRPGDVVALNGPLGAGKTTFSKALGQALGLTEPVTSPTFVLMHEYHTGPYPILHADLYRLGEENAESLSEELCSIIDAQDTLLLVEWACYASFLDAETTIAIDLRFSEHDNQDVPLSSTSTAGPDPAGLPPDTERWLHLSASRMLPFFERGVP